jgi:hypothetical protein
MSRQRVTYLTVSDELGGSGSVLLETITGIGVCVRTGRQLISQAVGLARSWKWPADCVVPAASSPARASSALAAFGGHSPRSSRSRFRLFHRLRRHRRSSLVLHQRSARLAPRRRDASVVWHLHEYVSGRRLRGSLASNAVDLQTFAPERAGRMRTQAVSRRRRSGRPVGLVATFARWKGTTCSSAFRRSRRGADRGYVSVGRCMTPRQSARWTGRRWPIAGLGARRFTDSCHPPAMRASISSCTRAASRPFGLVSQAGLRARSSRARRGAAELVKRNRRADAHARGPRRPRAEHHAVEIALRRQPGLLPARPRRR